MYRRAIIDALLFCLLPAAFYAIAEDGGFIRDSTYYALRTALLGADTAYIAAFALFGGYSRFPFAARFEVIASTFVFSSAYWIVLSVTDIAQGYGEGNVVPMLFGLAVAIAVARRQVLNGVSVFPPAA